MSNILYIGKDYCQSLEQLKEYFQHLSSDQDPLYNELLTLQRDGLIAQWLDEGDEREQEIANRIRNLTPELTNKELMESLTEILTNKNKNFNVNLHSYLELKEVSYALMESSSVFINKINNAILWFKKIENGEVLSVNKEKLNATLRLKLKFKVLKSEKESFCLKTILSLEQRTIHEISTNLSLDNEFVSKEKILYLDIPTNLLNIGTDYYSLEIKSDSQIVFSSKVVVGNAIEFNIDGVKFKMIKVDAGTFEMGAPNNDIEADYREKPQHKVSVDEFYIGETVVTQALWKAVMRKFQLYNIVSLRPEIITNPSHFKGDDLPVESISFHRAKKFIDILNELLKEKLHGKKFALPTEEQWEFAAQGGNKSKGCKFSGSNNIDEVAWYDPNSCGCTHPVKAKGKAPNELGIYGMSGNVNEWCDGFWKNDYSDNADVDIYECAVRGGSWACGLSAQRLTYRSGLVKTYSGSIVGFRLILK